jgi:hypothetical protein
MDAENCPATHGAKKKFKKEKENFVRWCIGR